MKRLFDALIRLALFAVTLIAWVWCRNQPMSISFDVSVVAGGLVLVFPVVWIGRVLLDLRPTERGAVWTTRFIHFSLMILLGMAIIRAIVTHEEWILPGRQLEVGLPADLAWS